MNGKQKCRILKRIREQIAQANDIELVVEQCAYQGDCKGVCPRCEAEVRYLERELEKRRSLKKRVVLAGVSAGLTLALSGCSTIERLADRFVAFLSGERDEDPITELVGDVPMQIGPDEGELVLDRELEPEYLTGTDEATVPEEGEFSEETEEAD